MSLWGYTQWGYVISAFLCFYYCGLALLWHKNTKQKHGPFFWYVFVFILGYGLAVVLAATARHFLLIGDIATRDRIIFSKWWMAQNIMPVIILFMMNIHATLRYIKTGFKNNP